MSFSISFDELENKPLLGKSIKCTKCGKRHKIIFGTETETGKKVKSDFLSFYKCGKKSYLAGISGRDIRK